MSRILNQQHKIDETLSLLWVAEFDDFAQSSSWHPSNDILAIGRLDGKISLHDGYTGKIEQEYASHPQGVMAIDWHPSGEILASGGQDTQVKLSKPLASKTEDSKADLPAARKRSEWVSQVKWKPDGQYLAVGRGRFVFLLQPDGSLAFEYGPLPSTISDLNWLPQSNLLLIACHYGVDVLDTQSRQKLDHLKSLSPVLKLSASPDGGYINLGNHDASVMIWTWPNDRTPSGMRGFQSKVDALAWSPEGLSFAVGSGADITIWDFTDGPPDGQSPQVLSGHQGKVRGVQFLKAIPRLISIAEDGVIYIWQRAAQEWQACSGAKLPAAFDQVYLNQNENLAAIAAERGYYAVYQLS